MSWGNIKVDKADTLFSLYVRLRDKQCKRCGRAGTPDKDGRPVIGLQCSHYWSRRSESTRYSPENCDALCAGCHFRWGGDYREEYKAFKQKQLGDKGYKMLEVLHNSYQKKDRKLAYLQAKTLLKEYEDKLKTL
jgi:hypothetical protein